MHIPTHILSGWVIASGFTLTARERCFAMIAATIADLDGIGYIAGPSSDAYQLLHHVLGHNIFFGVVASCVLAWFSSARIKSFILYLALFHLHLLMDLFGSGPQWAIYYLWPVSQWKIKSDHAWELLSWQNVVAGYGLLAITIFLAWRQQRTPLEYPMPELDRKLVRMLRRKSRDIETAEVAR